MRKALLYFVLISLLTTVSCSSGKQKRPKIDLQTITLKRDLIVSTDTLSNQIGDVISKLAVDSRGNIYLVDVRNAKIEILDSNGHYLNTIGRRGHGPGEFEFIRNIEIYNDTLYVLGSPNRLTKFSLDHLKLLETQTFPNTIVENTPLGNPFLLYPLPDGNYEVIFSFDPNLHTVQHTVSIVGHDLSPIDTVVRHFPVSHMFFYMPKGTRIMYPLPYGGELVPKTLMAFGPHGYIYEVHNDSLHVRVFDRAGKKTGDLSIAYSPLLLTRSDLDSMTAKLSANQRSIFQKGVAQSGIKVPGYWSVLKGMLIDDKHHCWVEMVTPGTAKQTWWVFGSDGKPKWKFQLSRHVKLYAIRKNEVYGVWSKQGEYPRIVRYRVEEML